MHCSYRYTGWKRKYLRLKPLDRSQTTYLHDNHKNWWAIIYREAHTQIISQGLSWNTYKTQKLSDAQTGSIIYLKSKFMNVPCKSMTLGKEEGLSEIYDGGI